MTAGWYYMQEDKTVSMFRKKYDHPIDLVLWINQCLVQLLWKLMFYEEFTEFLYGELI